MKEIISNYWLGLLIIGPLAGLFWSNIIKQKDDKYTLSNVQIGHNNSSKQTIKPVTNITNNSYYNNSKKDDDGMGIGLAVIAMIILIASSLTWGFATYGQIIIDSMLMIETLIFIFLLAFITTKLYSIELTNEEFIFLIIILCVTSLNLISLFYLEDGFRTDATSLANSNPNIIEFFFQLSKFGKTLLLTQSFCVIFLLFSSLFSIFQITKFNINEYTSITSWFIYAPLFGLLPLWLSNEQWATSFILEKIIN